MSPCLTATLITSAAAAFAISSPALRKDSFSIRYGALLIAGPQILSLVLLYITNGSKWPIYLCILASHSAIAFFLLRHFRGARSATIILLVTLAFVSFWILVTATSTQQDRLVSILPAELLLLNGVLFLWNYPALRGGSSLVMAGSALWSASLVVLEFYFQLNVFVTHASMAGELMVFIGMLLIIIQSDTRSAVQLREDYRTLFDGSPHMMWTIDQATQSFTNVNEAGAHTHGYTIPEFLALSVGDIIAPERRDGAHAVVIGRKSSLIRSSLHLRKDGSTFPMDGEARILNLNGRPTRLIIGTDVTERNQLIERLHYQATHDPLTQLLNRTGFHAEMDRILQEASRYLEMIALVKINIDRFRNVSDTYGENVGDRCLQIIAGRIRENLRASDIMARSTEYGFSVLLRGLASPKWADKWANQLLGDLTEPVQAGDYSIRLNLSIGVTVYPEDGTDSTVLRQNAWHAALRSRKLGNNLICHHSSDERDGSKYRLRLEQGIRDMLAQNRFALHYQPICLPDGQVNSLEALLVMNHPELGQISPAEFIPVAEESGLIIPLGQWVFEHACQQLNSWEKHGVKVVPVAINISALQFRLSNFAQKILATLDKYDIRHELIHIELTESAVLNNIAEAANEMRMLHSMGIHMSIDDFGTGYSSLARLHQMPISNLKIDQAFIHGFEQSVSTLPMIKAIIGMAHALNMQVVAEGVETAEQLSILASLGCNLIQGYLFSRPVPADRIPDLIQRGTIHA
ncbi:putative bifunctional diguanylate cyclase/phosphodiesterase [Silvibacterium acidisoli]|uniref:putative bifunctional diguanylate cyclase/phosphodiesterase n=1 Tax=Acidobacteriaceae bacterium ZG23-2 TaxID=2883246 RepID=UPI00406C1596